jgi:hypothetical protein
MPVAAPSLDEAAAAAPVCGKCGAALVPGKQFCKQCGQAVDAPAVATVFEQPSFAASNTAPIPTSDWVQVKGTVPLSSDTPATASVPAFAPVSSRRSNAKIGWAIGIAAAVLVVAGGGWAWYAHMNRSEISVAGPAAQQQGQPQDFAASTTDKPAAGSPAGTFADVPPPPPSDSSSSYPAQSAQGRSGVRHYQGPPVPRGGTVVFDNMPKARMKFTFNHAAWMLTIKLNPDGTKKVILSSIAQGYQSSCDLGWEIVD